MRKTVVHVIDDLGRGGTETLFMDLLPDLSKHYNVVLVTLGARNEFGTANLSNCHRFYCLNYSGFGSLAASVRKLKTIIREHEPVLVRSQLVMSTILCRLACPLNIPFIFSIHNTLSILIPKDVRGRMVRFIEKNFRKKNITLLGVTQAILDDYISHFNYKGPYQVMYNYVRKDFFSVTGRKPRTKGEPLRLVAIGNLRLQKNYPYLTEAFGHLFGVPVELDIYGDGPLRESLQAQIDKHNLKITLKGRISEVSKVIGNYDAFVMVSTFEGFGIAVAESMAAGVPLILSDIPVLREITRNQAIFVDPKDSTTFATSVKRLVQEPDLLERTVKVNQELARKYYSKEGYLEKLLDIYHAVHKGKPVVSASQTTTH